MKKILVYSATILTCFGSYACSEEKPTASASSKKESNLPKHEQYLAWHNECLSGKTRTIDAKMKAFEQCLKTNPNDHLATVYLGSASALRAKASFWGPSKLKYLKRGQKLMDAAIKAAPNDPRVRMVRAIGYYKVPKRFNCRKTSIKDFETLLPIVEHKPSLLLINERQAILYYAHLAFSEEGHDDADRVKKLCHQLDPKSKYGKLTR
jgi:hypothetical protein